jgi:hypothetical protein
MHADAREVCHVFVTVPGTRVGHECFAWDYTGFSMAMAALLVLYQEQLRTRILMWVEEQVRLDKLPPKSDGILEALLYRGELPRGEIAAIVDSSADRAPPRLCSGRARRARL